MIPTVLAAALALVGTAPANPAEPPPIYAEKTRDYDVALRISPDLQRIAPACARLKADGLAEIARFKAAAVKGKADQRAPGGQVLPGPMVERIEISRTVITAHLAGYERRIYADYQGAHAASVLTGGLLDRASGAAIAETDLLQPGTDTSPLNRALQQAVARARSERVGPDTTDVFITPQWGERVDGYPDRPGPKSGPANDATLAPSATLGKAGGLAFLYGPYVLGAYAEGAYRVVLPASLFLADLKAPYRDDFAPEPVGRPFSDPMHGFPADIAP